MEEDIAKIEGALHALGFPIAASKVYIYILKQGAVELSTIPKQFFDLSIGTIENSLAWLEEQSTICRQVDDQLREYIVPLDPQIVSRSFYSRFLWRYVPSDKWLAKLNASELNAIERYHNSCNLFGDNCSLIYRNSAQAPESSSDLEMVSNERLSSVLSHILSAASNDILGMTVFPWTPDIAVVWEMLKRKMALGVTYKRIADEITLVAFGHAINYRDVLELGVDLRVCNRERISDKFYIVDGTEAFVFFPGKPPENFKLEAMRVKTNPLVQLYKDTFEELWDEGVDGREVIEYVASLRNGFIEKCTKGLSDEERHIVEGLFDYGKFFKIEYASLEPHNVGSVLNSLALKNYLIHFSDSEIGFIPNLISEVRNFLRGTR